MNFDGKLLAQARRVIEERKASNEAEHRNRVEKIHAEIPEIASIDRQLRQQMASLMGLALRGEADLEEKLEELKQSNLGLQARRAELLVAHGYPFDYLDEIHSCIKCRDTGFCNGSPCSCLIEQYNNEMTRELGVLMNTGDESFENFDLTLYGTEPDEDGLVPREYMQGIYDICRDYAENFSSDSRNLFFTGRTGVGKTYLSACIARVVAEKGFSVCYDTASAALGYFEKEKFSRNPEESEEASSRVRRMVSCDLMILDDLGTEMVTPMSVSALYTLINDRLVHHRPTIISANLAADQLEDKYSQQIASRITGEYVSLPFIGKDIRLVKRERGI